VRTAEETRDFMREAIARSSSSGSLPEIDESDLTDEEKVMLHYQAVADQADRFQIDKLEMMRLDQEGFEQELSEITAGAMIAGQLAELTIVDMIRMAIASGMDMGYHMALMEERGE
jgi:hypothetical protein